MNEFMSITPLFPYLYPRTLLSIIKKRNVTDNTNLMQIIFFTMPDYLILLKSWELACRYNRKTVVCLVFNVFERNDQHKNAFRFVLIFVIYISFFPLCNLVFFRIIFYLI